jgi:hypothetical protein
MSDAGDLALSEVSSVKGRVKLVGTFYRHDRIPNTFCQLYGRFQSLV